MYFKNIILAINLLLILNGCERGVGEEPIGVKNVDDNNLIGTWVLSEKYTNKKVIERLDKNIKEYYFKIFPNYDLEYHSFDCQIGFSKPKYLNGKGTWEFLGKNILLKKKYRRIYYLDAEGTYSKSNDNPKMKTPITKYSRISYAVIYEFRITKKNNKLLLWYYDGDPDARRYIMYEKKSIN